MIRELLGTAIVKNVVFENFVETNVDNPVIIDQVESVMSSEDRRLVSLTIGYLFSLSLFSATRRVRLSALNSPQTP